MDKLFKRMSKLEVGLYTYKLKCEKYWNDEGRWEPKAKDIFKFANDFKRLAYYKSKTPLSLEERAMLTHIQSMMAVMAALIETCALNFPHCDIEADFWDARNVIYYWQDGCNDGSLWDKEYEENIFQKHREALARHQAQTEEQTEE